MRRFLEVAAVVLVGTVLALLPVSGAVAATPSPVGTAVVISPTCASGDLFCFRPANITIADGTTVTWTDYTGAEHIVARCQPTACTGVSGGDGTDATFTSGDVSAKGVFSHTFQGAGTYNYYCSVHGYAVMHGTIVVQAVAPPPTVAPPVTPPPTAAAPAAPAGPQLAHTGASPRTALVGAVLLVLGLAASSVTAGSASRRRAVRPRARAASARRR